MHFHRAEAFAHEFVAGEFIMFKSLQRGDNSPMTVRAASDVEVFVIPANDLQDLLAADQELAVKIEHVLDAREELAKRVLGGLGEVLAVGATSFDRKRILADLFQVSSAAPAEAKVAAQPHSNGL